MMITNSRERSHSLWFIDWSDLRVSYPSFLRHPVRWLRADWINFRLAYWRTSWGKPPFLP